MKNPIYPCIWFDGKAKEAAVFYCSVFKDSKIISETEMVVSTELNGRNFMLLNGGPMFTPNEAVSFVIDCETQEEIDYYWEHLSAGGTESMCGWLKDKFGVWWQIVPLILMDLLNDPAKAPSVHELFSHVRKFDIAELKKL